MQKMAVATSNAYMLFYMRRDAAPKSLNELFKCRQPTAEEIKERKKRISSMNNYLTKYKDKCAIS